MGQMRREDALALMQDGSYTSWPRLRRALRTLDLPEDTIRPPDHS
jgi:hypothetical protein